VCVFASAPGTPGLPVSITDPRCAASLVLAGALARASGANRQAINAHANMVGFILDLMSVLFVLCALRAGQSSM
jgi:hypothetical protein